MRRLFLHRSFTNTDDDNPATNVMKIDADSDEEDEDIREWKLRESLVRTIVSVW